MDKFVIKTPKQPLVQTPNIEESSKRNREEINVNDLPADPMDRRRMSKFNPNGRDIVRREYLQRGPHQPRNCDFPQKLMGKIKRKFVLDWFDSFETWLEYSEKGDAAFCLYCYLCADDGKENDDTSFTTGGFKNWKKPERLTTHIGGVNSSHNLCRRKCEDLMNEVQHIRHSFCKQTDQTRIEYKMRLIASIDCVQMLLLRGFPFRGHDESDDSSNMGNFKELLHFLADHNEEIGKVVLENAPKNNKLTCHQIQLDIAAACAFETTKVIVEDIGGDCFSILFDECRDASIKEQMALIVRYVNNKGCVIESFLGIAHVSSTTSLSLKLAIESILTRLKLSVSRIRGQGYDGASNMRGEFNGLKSLFLMENSSAYYVHCFAHQLQLVLVVVAKNDPDIALLFTMINRLVNVVGGSCKRRDMLRDKQFEKVVEAMDTGEIESGKGLHQECTLQRANDTRWSSHCNALVNIIILFPSILEVLNHILDDGTGPEQKGDAKLLWNWLLSFDFAFTSILMKNILKLTNELALTLQRKDLDIVNAMDLVDIAKKRLEIMRKNGWESLNKEVSTFCLKYNIVIPKMDDAYEILGRSRRHKVTILHHYKIEIFKAVIDWVFQELNNRFNEEKLVRLAELYPLDFSENDHKFLESQLENFEFDMKSSIHFTDLKELGCVAAKLVKMKKHNVYPLVYRLIKLVLLLPVSTASVERSFSTMKIVKTRLRNKMNDEWMNDSLVTYIERYAFKGVDTELIVQKFQHMKPRRCQLPRE